MPEPSSSPQPGHGVRQSYERLRSSRERRGDAEPTAYEEAHRKGADGELLVGESLNIAAEADGGVAVLHDLVTGRRGNIDHVVIGPAGVCIVDAKAWNQPTRLSPKGLYRGRYSSRKHFEGLARQKHRIHSVLAQAGRDDVAVESALCLVNGARGLDGEVRWHDGHGIGMINPVAKHAIRPGPLPLESIVAVTDLLRGHFSVRGGMVMPANASAPAPLPGPPREARRPRSLLVAVKPLALAVVAVVLMSVVVAAGRMVVAEFNESFRPSTAMTRGELDGQMPLLKELARERAGGPVGRRPVVERGGRFVVSFRRGKRCRVTVTVPRNRGRPRVSSKRC